MGKTKLWGEFEEPNLPAIPAKVPKVEEVDVKPETEEEKSPSPPTLGLPLQLFPVGTSEATGAAREVLFCPLSLHTLALLQHQRDLQDEDGPCRDPLPACPERRPSLGEAPELSPTEAYQLQRKALALQCGALGFCVAESEALETLADGLALYFRTAAKRLKLLAERRAMGLECGFSSAFAQWEALCGSSPARLADFHRRRVAEFHQRTLQQTQEMRDEMKLLS